MTPEVTDDEIRGTIAFLSHTRRSEHAEKRLRFWESRLAERMRRGVVKDEDTSEVTTEQQQLELGV